MQEIGYIEIAPQGKNRHLKILVDGDYDGEYFSQFKWYVSPHGYAYRPVSKYDSDYKGPGQIIYLHQEVARTPKGLVTDHINRNKLDNRSCNLRWASWKLNASNRRQGKRARIGSLGYRGVWDIYKTRPQYTGAYNPRKEPPRRFAAKLGQTTISYHVTPIEAAKAYDKAAFDKWGEDAELNFPLTVNTK